MGIYLNPGNQLFAESLRSQIYVDKTGMIAYTNSCMNTEQKYICVSRPRRFGKSMAAKMLTAYYVKNCDSRNLFKGLRAEKVSDYEEHLNKHDVFFLNMQRFLSRADSAENLVLYLQQAVIKELKEPYGDVIGEEEQSLVTALEMIYAETGTGFIFIIDEWDCIFREKQHDTEAQTKFLDFMRDLLKDQPYVDLVYMTGILPIKKYGTHSALNIFDEFSMTEPSLMVEYVGFTDEEVGRLCEQYQADYGEMQKWYDGYIFSGNLHIYNPKSVVDALRKNRFASYWTKTETYEALKVYIGMNFDGLKESVVTMLAGGRYSINTGKFQNDMTTFNSKDDVLTLLIHLGYLAYDADRQEVFIPNQEIADEFRNAVDDENWAEIEKVLTDSERLLRATLNQEEEAVARGIDNVHMEMTSVFSYNDENSLSCVISLAYFSARKDYILVRELPSGKGLADIVFVPRKHKVNPALVVELKWDKSAEGAIAQIKRKQYTKVLEEFTGDILLVGINYDKKDKVHTCIIEKWRRADNKQN